MPRAASAQNYLQPVAGLGDAGLVENFETAGDWANAGSTGTPTFGTDTTYFKTGSASYYLDQAAGSGNVKRFKYFGATGKDLSAVDSFYIWTYWPNGKVSTNTMTLYFSTGASGVFTNNNNVTLGATNTGTQKKGWNLWQFTKSQTSASGSGVTWSNVNNLQIQLTGVAGPDRVYVDSLYCGYRSRPKIIFSMDDSLTSQKAAADTAMTYGIPITLYVIPSLVGGGGYLTKTELTSLQSAGHLIACHHEDELQTKSDWGYSAIQVVQNWLGDNGFANAGKYHIAYPGGKFNPSIQAAMSALGMKTARTIGGLTYVAGPPETYESVASHNFEQTALGVGDLLALNSINLASNISLANAKIAIDNTIKRGLTMIFYAHNFGTGQGAAQWDTTDWDSLLSYTRAYIRQGLIDAVTIDKWYSGLTRRVPVS